jgi:hypothetical protein
MTTTFPTLVGLGWSIKKRVLTSTAIETSASGSEYRTARFATPIYEFDLTFGYLAQADEVAVEAFYVARNGPFESFNLAITNDPTSPFLVRFKDDKAEFDQMFHKAYQSKITFRTTR